MGIKLIVLPAVAAIIAATIYVIFGITEIETAEIGNGSSAVIGVALILVSLILNYGVELEQKNKV